VENGAFRREHLESWLLAFGGLAVGFWLLAFGGWVVGGSLWLLAPGGWQLTSAGEGDLASRKNRLLGSVCDSKHELGPQSQIDVSF
jgi:hypothetical protein